jgi:NADPH-dependent curcumin reductase CurA
MSLKSLNTCIRFIKPVTGAIGQEHFAQSTEAVPHAGPGQIVVRNVYLSLDPSQRRQMMPGVAYAEMLHVGDVMIGRAMGRVIESRRADLQPGDWVRGKLGWQHYALSDGAMLEKIDLDGFSPSTYLGVLGNPGITAWVGLNRIAAVQSGETVVVSAAAGAVGSVVAALALQKGCDVVGIAGGPEKCEYAVEQVGYGACVDYRAADFCEELIKATPRGVDVDFENVGGEIFDCVLDRMNDYGRVALCGLISQYNLAEPMGLRNVASILNHNVTVQGFRLANYASHRGAAVAELKRLLAAGDILNDETIVDGLDHAPQAFMNLFRGTNFGKMLVRLGSDD